jgi:hypothetical protein
MIKISTKKHEEVPDEGLRVYVDGNSFLALTSPEAQRMVYNYIKEAGYSGYGLNKFIPNDRETSDSVFPKTGYWLFLPTQWNRNSIRV